MPITYQGKKFHKFRDLVRYLVEYKGFSKEKAGRYAAGIERKQRGNNSSPIRKRSPGGK